MEKKIRICDDCKEVISKYKCEICGIDLCGNCNNKSLFSFDTGEVDLFHIDMCDNCYGKSSGMKNIKSIFGKPLKEVLLPILKKSVTLSKLEEGKK